MLDGIFRESLGGISKEYRTKLQNETLEEAMKEPRKRYKKTRTLKD